MVKHYPQPGISKMYGEVTPISPEEELRLADIISEHDSAQSEEAIDAAVAELVKAYSLLIEKICFEAYSNGGKYGYNYEDFISEGYVVAVQCARSFRPRKGRNIIKFSSYLSRAISSALFRTAMRSRSSVSIPSTTVSDARRWAKVMFDLESKGLAADDYLVSAISGVSSNQGEVRTVLRYGENEQMDDNEHPYVLMDEADSLHCPEYYAVSFLIEQWFENDSDSVKALLGIDDGNAAVTAKDFSDKTGMDRATSDKKMREVTSTMIHPIFRVFAHDIGTI